MGLSSLRELAVIESTPYDVISESVVAVDALNWLYRYFTTTVRFTGASEYTTADGTEVPNVIGIVQDLPDRQYVTEAWEIPEETLDRAFERLADSTPLSL